MSSQAVAPTGSRGDDPPSPAKTCTFRQEGDACTPSKSRKLASGMPSTPSQPIIPPLPDTWPKRKKLTLKEELRLLPDEPGYEDLPVEQFGEAYLRGYGYPSKFVGRRATEFVQPVTVKGVLQRHPKICLLQTFPYSDRQRWWSKKPVAAVTGGNRGIGFEITRQLAKHGLSVILTSRDKSVGQKAAKVLQEGGLDVVFHQLDVIDPESIQVFTEWIQSNYEGIDILVNNAGVNFNVGSENSVESAHMVVATNYYGTKNMIKAMIPLMRKSAAGARIVNVSSTLGRLNGRRNRIEDVNLREKLGDLDTLTEGLIDQTVETFLQQVDEGTWRSGGWPQTFTDYSISKLAVNLYTRLMAKMLSDRPEGEKIYVNCYCPGWVKTAVTGWSGNISVEQGADTGVWLALLPDQAITGKFFAVRREISF